MLDLESVAKPFLSQWVMHVPKGWTGSELKLWPIFLNNILVLGSSDKEQHFGCKTPVDDALWALQPHFMKNWAWRVRLVPLLSPLGHDSK